MKQAITNSVKFNGKILYSITKTTSTTLENQYYAGLPGWNGYGSKSDLQKHLTELKNDPIFANDLNGLEIPE